MTFRRETPAGRWWDEPQRQPSPRPVYVGPLTASQHILHLLLTVLTGGLWAPVWIWRAIRGNTAPSH